MSDDILFLVTILSVLASAVALWSSIRRRQLLRRFLRSLDEEQLRTLRQALEQDGNPQDPTEKK